jgi:hypothetical protein
VPGLKASDSNKLLLYKVLQSVVATIVDVTYVQNVQLLQL